MAVTLEQLVSQLTESGLATAEELSAISEGLPPDKRPRDAEELTKELVRRGKLTKYQAMNVFRGKAKGLFFGEYLVLDKLGAGGMGQVFRAQHRRMKRIVALKLLPPAAMQGDGVERFYREVQTAALLTHPNIVTAYDAGEAHGMHFLIMEFVDGQDLSAFVKRQGPLPPEQAAAYVLQAARGLEYAHRQNVVHRDIKPGNLLLDRQGRVKILDMGLALVSDPLAAADQAGMTQAGLIMGTVDYMAPEQAQDTHTADARSDIYSLGCTLYRLLTNEMAYKAESAIQKILAHRDHPVPSVRRLRPEVPAELDAICIRMMAKRPADRFQSMREVIAQLERCNTALGATDTPLVTDVDPIKGTSISSLSNSGISSSSSQIEGVERTLSGVGETSTRSSRSTRTKAAEPTNNVAPKKPPWLWIGAGAGAAAVVGGVALVFMLGGEKRAPGESPRTTESSPVATASAANPTMDHQAEKPSTVAAASTPEPLAAIATSSPKPAASTPAAGATTGTAKAAAAPVQPSIRSEFSVGKTVNLAPLLDLVGDRVAGVWQARGGNLLSPDTEYARIRIPVTPPADYRLKIVARRVAGKDALGLGLVVGGSATVLCLDYGAQGTAFAWYDGKAGPATSSYRSQVIFDDNQPRTIQCTVHPGHVVATSDDKTIFEWSGNHKLLSATVKYAIPDKQCLFLASHNSVFEIRKLELTPLDAEPAGTALASSSVTPMAPKPPATKPATTSPAATKTSPAANTPPAASTAAAQPAAPKTARPLTGPIDLLKLVDLKKGAVGSWLQEAGALVRTGTGDCRAPIPFFPPKDYDLVVTVAGPVGQTDNSFVFVVEGRKVGFQYTPRLPAPTIIFDCRQPVNMAYRPVSISDANATQANFVCSVRGPRVYITVDDQPVLDWTGDPKTLEVWSWHEIASCAGFIAAARGKEPGLRFTKFEISPPALKLPEFSRVDWLALVDPKRDRTSGEPRSEGGDLVLPPTIEPKGSNVGVNIAHSSEYVVTAVVERLNGRGELGAGMMIGDHRAAAQVDALGQTSFSTVATFTRDWLLTPWRQHTLTYGFTAQSAHLKIDGREVLNYPQPPFNIRSVADLDVADPRISTIHSHYLAGFQISSWEVAPLGWRRHARPSASQLADAVKALQPSLAPARAKDAKADQKSNVAESLWRQAAISSDDDARRFALLDAAALLAAQAGNLPLACHAATDLARWFDGDNQEWFTTLATEMMKAGRTTADRQKLVFDSLRQIDRAQALEEFDLAVALQTAALAVTRPANSDAAKELKARGSELRFYQAERTAYLPAQAVVDAGQANAAANRTVGRYLGLVRGDWTLAARVLEQADDPILLAIAKGELTPSDEAEQQVAQAERWWSLFEKGESPLKFLAMERAAIWYRRAGSKLSGKAKITLDQRRRIVAQQRRPSNLAFMQRHPVDAVKLGEHWYKRYPGMVNWSMAARFCDDVGGSLLMIESAAENEAVARIVMAAGGKQEKGICWLGCSDEAAEGQWSWVSGAPLNGSAFSGWPSGQPDNAGGDSDYGVLEVLMENGRPTIKWDDRKAVDLFPFICEWEL